MNRLNRILVVLFFLFLVALTTLTITLLVRTNSIDDNFKAKVRADQRDTVADRANRCRSSRDLRDLLDDLTDIVFPPDAVYDSPEEQAQVMAFRARLEEFTSTNPTCDILKSQPSEK